MVKQRKGFEKRVRKFCVTQVGGLTLCLVAAVVFQFLFFPECRVNGRLLSAAVLFFFLLAVLNFMLHMLGKGRMNGGYVFGLVMLLTLVWVWRMPAMGGLFAGQMVLFAAGEWLFDALFYRRLN